MLKATLRGVAVDRRRLLQLMTLTAADLTLFGLVGCATSVPRPQSENRKKGKTLIGLEPTEPGVSVIRIYDWDTHDYEDISVPLDLVHSMSQDRVDPNILYVFEIFGSCLRFDLTTKSILKVDHRGTTQLFNGHGAQTSSGEFISCTEITEKGSVLTLRSAKTLAMVADTPVECNNCHQVVSLPKSSLVACGNLRGLDQTSYTGGITFFDYESRKVANRIEFPMPVLHMLPVSSTEVIGLTLLTHWKGEAIESRLSTQRNSRENIDQFSAGQNFIPGPLYYANVNGATQVLWDPNNRELFTDNFGIAGIDSRSFLSGHHGSGKVIYWRDQKIVKVFSVPDAKNIVASADGSEFMAISGNRIMTFSLETLSEVQPRRAFPPSVVLASYRST